MIKAVLIDDEKNALEVLSWQLATFCPQVQPLALCRNAQDGIAAIKAHQPDLVFLDIEMPKQNGFELIEAFDAPAFNVIFTTAYDQFAVRAFKYAAFDFLLKPIDAEDLKAAVVRFEQKKKAAERSQFDMLIRQLRQEQTAKIALPTQDGILFADPEQIIRCESSSNYCWIHFTNQPKLLIAKTLKEIEELLKPFSFYRLHHSHLVNLRHISRYVKADGGYIEMADGSNVAISRQKKEAFIALLLQQENR